MTARLTRPLRRRGPKLKNAPANAADRIEELAANGASMVGVGAAFGVSVDTLRRWLDDMPDLQEAFDRGRERERLTLHNALFRMATEKGHAAAAMFLLKARHGYREGDQAEQGNRLSINFNLPAALPLEAFQGVISGEVVSPPSE